MTKFTPGPWDIVSRFVGPLYVTAKVSRGDDIGETMEVAHVGANTFALAQANANLIAAAPDLYAALVEELDMRQSALRAIEAHHDGTLSLEEFEHIITGIFTGSFVGDRTRAALTKARGET